MQYYEANDQKLKKFVPIIKNSLVYPVVLDATRTVLSLPPIINGAHSAVRSLSCAALLHLVAMRHLHRGLDHEKCHLGFTSQICNATQITLQTKDVFIECTATDLTKAQIVLHTITTMFSEYCSTPFEVEPVEVVDALGKSHGVPHGQVPSRRSATGDAGHTGRSTVLASLS